MTENTIRQLLAKGQTDKAMASMEEALSVDPDNTQTLGELATCQFQLGMKEAVMNTIKKLLSIDPEFYSAYSLLARARQHKEHDEITRKMQDIFAKDNLSNEGRVQLGFALGKVYEDLGEYDKAIEAINTANNVKRATINYSTERNDRDMSQTIAKFSKSYVRQYSGGGYHDKTPIFVVGMPRSGTSLVEQILSSHPDVFGAGELRDFPSAIDNHEGKNIQNDTFFNIGQAYIASIRKLNSTSTYIVDKYPQNFTQICYILLSLPDAKIIHCVRNPMDNCFASYKNLYMEGAMMMSYDLTEMGAGHLAYLRLMRHWHQLFPGKILDMEYEDLISNQHSETKKLLDYCELQWSDRCLNFHKTKRLVQSYSSMQVKQPIYSSSVRLWEHYSRYLNPLKLALEGKKVVEKKEETILINGKTYKLADLSEEAIAQAQNVKAVENELIRLQRQTAMTTTARIACIQAFAAALADTSK